MYIWERKAWPNFTYDLSCVQETLYQYACETSSLAGGLSQVSEEMKEETAIDLMVLEALKTSEIEGEKLNVEELRSSVRKQLGLSFNPKLTQDPKACGIAALMISVRETFKEKLSKKKLFEWHRMIFSGQKDAELGKWRTSQEPMQIVSGAIGHEIIHYEAPPSGCLDAEMEHFIFWFNETDPMKGQKKIPGPVRAAITHLYFECLHPFFDGNGRIGRALSEKALSQDLGHPVLLSLSTTIERHKKEYYRELSEASRGEMDITEWINYFVKTVYEAQLDSKKNIIFVLQKAKFWNNFGSHLNERQAKVIRRIFKEGVSGFEGGMSAQKYMRITECSKATATRDLTDLLTKRCLEKLPESGRSTRYEVKLPTNKLLV